MSLLSRKHAAAIGLSVSAALLGNVSLSSGAIDNLEIVVTKAKLGSITVGGFAYDPTGNGTIYVAGFGATASWSRIDNVNLGNAAQTNTQLVSNTQWTYFMKDGVLDRSGGAPTIGGIVLNTTTVNGHAPYTMGWITDAGSAVKNSATVDGNTNTRNDLTQRLYSWNLQAPATIDGRTVLSSAMTFAQYNVANGLASTSTSSSAIGRQPALNSSNTALYWLDSSTAFSGLWRMDTATNVTTRILADTNVGTTEFTVVSNGGVDRIYYGNSSSAAANPGELRYVEYNNTTATTSAPQVVLTKAQINSFMDDDAGTKTPNITTVVQDPATGTLYLGDTVYKTLYALDTSGRLYKVSDTQERTLVQGGSPNSNFLRPELRTTTFNGQSVSQLLYEESGTIANVSGAYLFKPGDFNRDGNVDNTDLQLFKGAIIANGLRGSTIVGLSTSTDYYKFDMNGNNNDISSTNPPPKFTGGVDWKDIKILQTFIPFADGDADFNGTVDQTDLSTFQGNWGKSASRWTDGKFDGGPSIFDPKGQIIGAADLTILSANWGSTDFGATSNSSIGRFVADLTTSATPAINLTTGDTAVLAAKSAATGGTKLIITTTVAIDNASKLDLKDNDLISRGSTPADLRALLLAGYGGTVGLTTTTSEGLAHTSGLGYLLGSDYKVINGTTLDGIAVGDTDTVVKYTVMGDVDLNGTITGTDFAQIDAAYLSGLYATGTDALWIHGDFNYDGVISTADFALIDAAFLILHPLSEQALARIAADTARFGAEYSAQLQENLAAVPEPSSLALLGLAGLLTLRAKRK